MSRLIKLFKEMLCRVNSHKLTVHAAQATLFMIISVLPLTMLTISLIKYIIPFDRSDVAQFLVTFVPSDLFPVLGTLLDEIFSGASVSLISATTIAAIWAASRGIMSLVQGLESVYESADRGYIKTRLLAFVYTIFFIAIIIATLLFFVAGRYVVGIIAKHFPVVGVLEELAHTFPVVIYLFILTFVFGILYKLLPGGGLSFVNQLPGAFFSALGWVCFTAGYSFYVNRFANYSYIYGSLTAVVLLILWLYFCMNIFLLGAELNCFLKERKEKHIEG